MIKPALDRHPLQHGIGGIVHRDLSTEAVALPQGRRTVDGHRIPDAAAPQHGEAAGRDDLRILIESIGGVVNRAQILAAGVATGFRPVAVADGIVGYSN